jgi:hypothetical protein
MKCRGTIALWAASWQVSAIGQPKQGKLTGFPLGFRRHGHALSGGTGREKFWRAPRLPRTFVLHTSIVLLYSAYLAFMRCHTNLNLIGDRAEIRPPICRIASGSGGLADRKEEQSWLK